MSASSPSTNSPEHAILQMATSYWVSQALYAAAKLGIADHLTNGPKHCDELATATQAHAPALYRLLRALAGVGVFSETEEQTFALTPLAECLLNRPGSKRSLVLMMGEEHYRSWGDLVYSLRTGRPAFDHIFGKPVFHYLSEHPEQAAIFDDAMTGIHGSETPAMIEAYDFSGIGTIVDIGGGNGTLLKTVLQKYPEMKGILYDMPHVIDRARANFQGLEHRSQLLSGSFFESIPQGGDAYIMRHIIHDWNDEQCHTILGNCRKVMRPDARLLVVDAVLPPGNNPGFSKFLDLTMLVLPGGKERTEKEFRTLYQSAGFELVRIVPTESEVSIIEGKPN